MNCGYCLEEHQDAIEVKHSAFLETKNPRVCHLICPCCRSVYELDGAEIDGPRGHPLAKE